MAVVERKEPMIPAISSSSPPPPFRIGVPATPSPPRDRDRKRNHPYDFMPPAPRAVRRCRRRFCFRPATGGAIINNNDRTQKRSLFFYPKSGGNDGCDEASLHCPPPPPAFPVLFPVNRDGDGGNKNDENAETDCRPETNKRTKTTTSPAFVSKESDRGFYIPPPPPPDPIRLLRKNEKTGPNRNRSRDETIAAAAAGHREKKTGRGFVAFTVTTAETRRRNGGAARCA